MPWSTNAIQKYILYNGQRDFSGCSLVDENSREPATLTRRSSTIWWRHQMEAFSALLAICAGNSPVPGEFPTQRPVTQSFDVYFDLRLNKRLRKQSWGWWFETLLCPLWRHSNDFEPAPELQCFIIHERHGVSNHRQPDCLFNSYLKLTHFDMTFNISLRPSLTFNYIKDD